MSPESLGFVTCPPTLSLEVEGKRQRETALYRTLWEMGTAGELGDLAFDS